MSRPATTLAVLCAAALGLLPVAPAAAPGAGAPDPAATAVARKAFVLAEFVSETCPACDEMSPVVRAVLARHPGVVHQVHDADAEADLAKAYQVRCVPVYVVVDPGGRVRFNDVGLRTEAELEEILRGAGVGGN